MALFSDAYRYGSLYDLFYFGLSECHTNEYFYYVVNFLHDHTTRIIEHGWRPLPTSCHSAMASLSMNNSASSVQRNPRRPYLESAQ